MYIVYPGASQFPWSIHCSPVIIWPQAATTYVNTHKKQKKQSSTKVLFIILIPSLCLICRPHPLYKHQNQGFYLLNVSIEGFLTIENENFASASFRSCTSCT